MGLWFTLPVQSLSFLRGRGEKATPPALPPEFAALTAESTFFTRDFRGAVTTFRLLSGGGREGTLKLSHGNVVGLPTVILW